MPEDCAGICPSCGSRIEDATFTFCPHCGTDIDQNIVRSNGESNEAHQEREEDHGQDTNLLKRSWNLGRVAVPGWLIFTCCVVSVVLAALGPALKNSQDAVATRPGEATSTASAMNTVEPTETVSEANTRVTAQAPKPAETLSTAATRKLLSAPPEGRATSVPPTPDTSNCTLDAAFGADITIPDDTSIDRWHPFTKTWRISNTGTCDWGRGFYLTYIDGDKLKGPDRVPVPHTPAGESAEVSVRLVAPREGGQYRGYWRVCAVERECFGERVYVQILAPTVTPNVAATKRSQAQIEATATIEAYVHSPPQGAWCSQNSATRGVCVAEFRYLRSIAYTNAPSNGRFVAFIVAVKNIGSTTISMNPNDVTLVMEDGSSYSYRSETFAYWANPMQHVNIAPGDNARGGIVFLVPNDVGVKEVVYRGGLFESSVTIDLQRPPDGS